MLAASCGVAWARCVLLTAVQLVASAPTHLMASHAQALTSIAQSVDPQCLADVIKLTMPFSTAASASSSSAASSSSSCTIPHHPRQQVAMDVVGCVMKLLTSSAFASVQNRLLESLMQELCSHVIQASGMCRDISTDHPYKSGERERGSVRLPGAKRLLVLFDKRNNVNEAHGHLTLYADAEMTKEIGGFTGSSLQNWPCVIVPGHELWYSFVSGPMRRQPYEFGFKMRVVPLEMEASTSSVRGTGEEGLLDQPIFGGWDFLARICEHPEILDLVAAHASGSQLMRHLLRYLTVARAPHKLFVTRVATLMAASLKNFVSLSAFKQWWDLLLSVMDQLLEGNLSAGWGCSPFLQALVDLVRVARPLMPQLDEHKIWSAEGIANRPSGWFFLDILRTEALSAMLLHSRPLSSPLILEQAMTDMSNMSLLRWCLKQPELCLKLHVQNRSWSQQRIDWLKGVASFSRLSQAGDLLLALKQSLTREAFRDPEWHYQREGREWDQAARRVNSIADAALLCLQLENALRWEGVSEVERAFGNSWAARRHDWMIACKGLVNGTHVAVASFQEVLETPWNVEMDKQLVHLIDSRNQQQGRRLASLAFRDIMPLTAPEREDGRFVRLLHVPIEVLRARFALLRMLGDYYTRILPCVELRLAGAHTLAPLLLSCVKQVLFFQAKLHFWKTLFGRLFSEEQPQFVILNRQQAINSKARLLASPHNQVYAASALRHSIFHQLYSHVGKLIDPASLRRRGQAWMVKFVGEGGHDVGGMFNESIVAVTDELQCDHIMADSTVVSLLPFFTLCSNGRSQMGNQRDRYVPNSGCTSPSLLSQMEFVGRLMGIAALDTNRVFPIALPNLIWKQLAGEPVNLADLREIDQSTCLMLETLRSVGHPGSLLTADNFESLFPSLYFTATLSDGTVVELCPGGKSRPVRFEDVLEYAERLEHFRLNEFSLQHSNGNLSGGRSASRHALDRAGRVPLPLQRFSIGTAGGGLAEH